MRIAVVGTGIAGLMAAHRLQGDHDLTVYEADDRVGGHTHTVEVEEDGRPLAVDTGFIVFNHGNYPRFSALLDELGVASRPSDMSFSVRDERTGMEYRGSSLDTLFAQRRNLVRPAFHRMVWDIARFYREAPRVVGAGDDSSLGDYLREGGYGRLFRENHLLPMAAALWSTDVAGIEAMPLRFLVRFLENHGMMRFRGRPAWRVVEGGSSSYVRPLVRPFGDRIRLSTPVETLRRGPGGPEIVARDGSRERFDRVVVATHADQALRLLGDPSPAEREILGAFRTQRNDVALHTDVRLLPRARRAWSSWNYHVTREPRDVPTVTYHMNQLQGFSAREQYLVTLNRTPEIDPARVLRTFVYHHPIFDRASVAAQARLGEIDGVRDTWFVGAWRGFGFHEDGARSGEEAAAAISRGARSAA